MWLAHWERYLLSYWVFSAEIHWVDLVSLNTVGQIKYQNLRDYNVTGSQNCLKIYWSTFVSVPVRSTQMIVLFLHWFLCLCSHNEGNMSILYVHASFSDMIERWPWKSWHDMTHRYVSLTCLWWQFWQIKIKYRMKHKGT